MDTHNTGGEATQCVLLYNVPGTLVAYGVGSVKLETSEECTGIIAECDVMDDEEVTKKVRQAKNSIRCNLKNSKLCQSNCDS